MNKIIEKLADAGVRVYLAVLALFAGATVYFGKYELAVAEAIAIFLLLGYSLILRKRRRRQLSEYIEKLNYATEDAKSNTLMNFPLPIVVFKVDDSRIIWGNDKFFEMCGNTGSRLDASIADLVPGFTSRWMLEGLETYPELLELDGRRYQLQGSTIRSSAEGEENGTLLGISYWVDVTDYDNIRIEYEQSRPVAGIIVIDNLDEMCRNQPDRVKNDVRDAVEDRLHQWSESYGGIVRRYDRDRYIALFEKRDMESMKLDKFKITEQMHGVTSPGGISASISIGFGTGEDKFSSLLQLADSAAELALSRGGDQAVIKNRMNYEFFGGRGFEVEKRTKVRSRVMATTISELIRGSSKVLIMSHKMADLDSVGAAVGICCAARKLGVKASIVIDQKNMSQSLISYMRRTAEYKDVFMSPNEAVGKVDGRTLLVVVDTSRPEQTESSELLTACSRVAVIDHHRVAATYIPNASLGFVEPYASSTCELVTEIIQELTEPGDILRCEAEALLAGIVLDTKSFAIRTGERTFDAASFLRRVGADTVDVKRLLQTDLDDTIEKYRVLQSARIYRGLAIAIPDGEPSRLVAAQAADELLNISGVDASIVVAADGKGGAFASARSIGDINVQILMEKLGGGGNRSVAAAQFADMDVNGAAKLIYSAIDDYMGT